MPAPLTIRPRGGAGDPVATLDGAGNETITGNLTLSGGVIYLGLVSAAPAPVPGAIALYTLDGVTVQFVAAGGQAGGQSFAGNVAISGTLAVTGKTTLSEQLTINSSDVNGALRIVQSVPTTGNPGTIAHQESASTNGAYGLFVNGDSNARFTLKADGTVSWGPGNTALDTVLARSAAGVLSLTTGSFSVTTAGQGLRVKEGSNAKQGTATLTAGSAVVANTSVTANSRILLTSNADGGTPGWLRVSARTAGTSFTITSSSGTDTSTVAYQIFEPG